MGCEKGYDVTVGSQQAGGSDFFFTGKFAFFSHKDSNNSAMKSL